MLSASLPLSLLPARPGETRHAQDWQELISRRREQLQQSDDPNLKSLARHMTDADDWKIADLLDDADIAVLDQKFSELREVNQALQRIGKGTYGMCGDCGRPLNRPALSGILTDTFFA